MEADGAASLSRRNVLGGMAATGMLAACSGSSSPMAMQDKAAAAAAAAAAQGERLAHAEMDRWAALVGTEFTAAGFRLKLTGVRALASTGARPADVTRQAAFLVVFDLLSAGPMPGDLIYAMSAPGIGPLDVFLGAAPSAEFPGRMQAVFN